MRTMRDGSLVWPALYMVIIFGCDSRNRDPPTPATLSKMYFDVVVTCNGTKLPRTKSAVPASKSFTLDAKFRSKRTAATVGFIVTLLDDGSGHILNSCGGIAKMNGDTFDFHCELEAPQHARKKCILEIRDSNDELIFTAPLVIDF
jgi:hypothetical protein